MLAGIMARPRAISLRTCSEQLFAGGDVGHLFDDDARAGQVHLRHVLDRFALSADPPLAAAAALSFSIIDRSLAKPPVGAAKSVVPVKTEYGIGAGGRQPRAKCGRQLTVRE
jgi:hypothetical protein